MKSETIDTKRIVLKKIALDDAAFIYELVNTAGWIKNIGNRNIHSIVDAQNYIQKIINNPNLSYWIANLKNSKFSIGIITLIKRDYLEHHDIGFAFLPQYTQNGYAYEATKAVLDEIAKSQLYSCIFGITIGDNHNSIRLLEKLGLTFDDIIDVENESLLRYSLTILK